MLLLYKDRLLLLELEQWELSFELAGYDESRIEIALENAQLIRQNNR